MVANNESLLGRANCSEVDGRLDTQVDRRLVAPSERHSAETADLVADEFYRPPVAAEVG